MIGYYIYFEDTDSVGVSKKIQMQIGEFERFSQIEEVKVNLANRSLVQRLFGLLPFISTYKWDINFLKDNIKECDYIYIRRTFFDKQIIDMLKILKEISPSCKILMEFPTYPYDKDNFSRMITWPFYFKDVYYRRQLKYYIDKIVTLTNEKSIFGISTIQTMNGIKVSTIKPIERKLKNQNEIHLIAVAVMQKHHGYERIFLGLKWYYRKEQKRIVYLHMVGEGPNYRTYVKLVEKYKLNQYVIFYQKKEGQDLDEIYNKADIAIAALGCYRDGRNVVSTIKVCEYLAKGLPVILAGKETIFLANPDYSHYMEVPNDKSILSITDIINFYDFIYQNNKDRNEITKEIRSFSKQTADSEKIWKPIADYLMQFENKEETENLNE